MPQLDSDSFTYSNGNLATVSSGKWTKLSGFPDLVVDTNQIEGTNADTAGVITTWSGSTTDQYSQITLSTHSTAGTGGPSVRSNSTSTFYMLYCSAGASNNEYRIYKVVSGTFTALGANAGTAASGDVAYLEMQGTTLISKDTGVTLHTITSESSIASGSPGVFAFSTGQKTDDWVAGDFAAGGDIEAAGRRLALLGVC